MKYKVYGLVDSEFGPMTDPSPIYPNYPQSKMPQGYVLEDRGVYPSGYKRLDFWALVAIDSGPWVTKDGQRVSIANIHLTGEIRWWLMKIDVLWKGMGYVPEEMGVKPYKESE